MKSLVLIATIALLAGCTSKNDSSQVRSLTYEVESLQDKLNTCQARLSLYTQSSVNENTDPSDTSSSTQEEQAAPEPQCDTVTYDELYVDGRLLTTCVSEDVVRHECGISATNCENGFAYACLKDVKYKTVEKQVCN
jgi:outer membrane murein-binding lipoprotein Lpp